MIIYSHPRSGSTALLKIYKWLQKNVHGTPRVLDLGEWLNFGAMNNNKQKQGLPLWLDRGRDKEHKWKPFYQGLVQHFIHDERTEAVEHTYCVVDTDVFDLDFDDPDFLVRSEERWGSKGYGLAHGDPVGHPLKEVTRTFNSREDLSHSIIEEYNHRVHYIQKLKKHRVPFVVKIFPNQSRPFFVKQNLQQHMLVTTPQKDDAIIIANDISRSVLSLALLFEYKTEGTVHNYQDVKRPVAPQEGKRIKENFMQVRLLQLDCLYNFISQDTTSNIITKDDLFVKQQICINGVEYNLKEYFDTETNREYAMRYTEDLANYFVNTTESIARLHKHILEHYPDIAQKYLKL